MLAGAGVETLFQDAQAATVTENGKKHSDKQVVIFECFAVFVCVAGIDVALENTVHDRLDKGVDAGYCVHGLQLLFFELFTGFYPGEQESATLYLWVGIFFRTVVPLRGRGLWLYVRLSARGVCIAIHAKFWKRAPPKMAAIGCALAHPISYKWEKDIHR